MSKDMLHEQEVIAAQRIAKDIFIFAQAMFGLIPQTAKPEFQKKLAYIYSLEGEMFEEGIKMIKPEWFGDYDAKARDYIWFDFQKGKHLTWQQTLLMMCANKAVQKKIKWRLSIASGHGIGKTSSCAIIILWFLFGRVDSQVGCTAPTATQMHDVLWKELSLWIGRMPEKIRNLYEHNKDYIRIKERPDSWFARAKTSSKENSEALAGVHAEWVMLLADEASGIEEQIFTVMDGALTSGNFLVILIGNPTRNNGYFYDSHHRNNDRWVNVEFSGIESPLVDKKYEDDQAKQHGRDSEEYGIRVLGKFPSEDTMSKDGYVRLIGAKDVNTIPKTQTTTFGKNSILGIDPSGEGDDKTVFSIRDEFKARVIFKESTSNPKYIAEKILTFIDMYDLNAQNVVVDAFGVGTTISAEVAKASNGKHIIQSINVGEPCDYEDEKDEYMNKRALYFHKGLRGWIRAGGQIVEDSEVEAEIETIYFKRNLQGKVQIMPKTEMKKRGYKSPNCLDSIMLTFHRQVIKRMSKEDQDDWVDKANAYDPFGGSF